MKRYIATCAVLAFLIGPDIAHAGNGTKTLDGFFLGQSRVTVEYKLGPGHMVNGVDTLRYYPSKKVLVNYSPNGKIDSIESYSKTALYTGISVGDKIPLGKCIIKKNYMGKNFCAYRFNGYWYDPYNGWAKKTNNVLALVKVTNGIAQSISITGCYRLCRVTPGGIILD